MKKLPGRVQVKFNTGTRPHKSPKDYTRKLKHKKKDSEGERQDNDTKGMP